MKSDLTLCLRFGWTWDELMATPAPVVEAAVGLLNDLHDEADAARARPWPEGG